MPGPHICDFWTREASAANYDDGSTFQINLVGCGYPNVRELNEVEDFNDPKVGWVKGRTPAGDAA